ncbi:MAG: hypothetical protein EAZ55_08015 [Cytophagales bacterium]|nr:MAG: hypothetical protein EAZ55_08015 [Cytophagales bacterium]
MKNNNLYILVASLLFWVSMIGCSGGGGDANPTSNNNNNNASCTNSPTVSIASRTSTSCGTNNGAITVSGSGGTGTLSYSINGGTFQSSTTFTGLPSGEHTITVRDANNCTSTVTTTLLSGVSYATNISTIIQANCAISSCHVAGGTSPNFSNFSNIQSNASNIKTRISNKSMPPASSGRSLTDAQIQLMNCWISDGAPNN